MKIPEGFYVIHQPAHTIPDVSDLHERGMFKTRPFVTRDSSYRVICNENLSVRLEIYQLVEKNITDPETGQRYTYSVENVAIDLDVSLQIKSEDQKISWMSPDRFDELIAAYKDWRNSFVPVNENGEMDAEGLKDKLQASIEEGKRRIRNELVRRNSAWVNAAMPRLMRDFLQGLYLKVEDRLYETYKQTGGTETEKELIKKTLFFQCIYDGDKQNPLQKPDGSTWKNEDEIWECWIGFAGSETEAKNICRTMDTVFRPLAQYHNPIDEECGS